MNLRDLEQAIQPLGLVMRGAFEPGPEDGVPEIGGRRAAGLVLLGNVGPGLWQAFSAAPEALDGLPDPLDRWSRRVIDGLAQDLGGAALYPFGGPPYRPFIAWAKRAEAVTESPLGMLIHPDHGLWHAYRGALAFAEPLAGLPPKDTRARPCDSCADRPCLQACPVAAFGEAGYDVQACSGHLESGRGEDCNALGCRARRACPVGQVYDAEQAAFHMKAFRSARRMAE